MKKKSIIITVAISFLFIGVNQLISNPTGAPAGYSNSPSDGQNCTNCHGGSVSLASNVISSNVPSTGYVPGNTYTITVSIPGTTAKKGFEVSPQSSNGTVLGTLTAGIGNRVLNSKYVTHTAAKSSNPGIWTFSWKAPIAGTGVVNFYGSFVNGYSNTSTQILAIQEQARTSVLKPLTYDINGIVLNTIYPNPTTENLTVEFNLVQKSEVEITAISIDGKVSKLLLNTEFKAGIHNTILNTNDLQSGVYIVRFKANNTIVSKQIIKQ